MSDGNLAAVQDRRVSTNLDHQLLICNGMPRSASTWSFNAAVALIRGTIGTDVVAAGYDEDLGGFLSSLGAEVEYAVVKSHTLDDLGRSLSEAGKARVVYTRRDPADAIASAMAMWGWDFETAFESIKWSLALGSFHARTGNALMVDYEEIVGDTLRATERLARYLGMFTDPDLIRTVAEATSIDRMREKADELTSDPRRLETAGSMQHDPETLLHPGHIRDGGAGYGRERLTEEQQTRVDALLAEEPDGAMGYSLGLSLPSDHGTPAWVSRAQAQGLSLPTISIVTPSFNRKAFLADAMDSVLTQRYPKLEYVVVDGGSTDGSAELVAARSEELAWSVSEPDAGAWEAINKGFAHTSGEVMGWLGSDDLLLPWTLSTVGELFARFAEVEWLTTRFPLVVDEDGRAVACGPRETYSREGFFRGENLPEAGWPAEDFIMQEGTFWRRSLWERAGGRVDESLRLAADFELWARFFRSGAELYGVNTPLAGFRLHGNQKSQTERAAYIEEAREVFFRYGGKPRSSGVPVARRIVQHVLPLGLRRALGRAVTSFLGLPGPQQGPMIAHHGPGREWAILWPTDPSDGDLASAD